MLNKILRTGSVTEPVFLFPAVADQNLNTMKTSLQQTFDLYTTEDLEVWNILFERQLLNLGAKGANDYWSALQTLNPVLNANELPNFEKINAFFQEYTQWELVVVPGLIPVEEFFALLSDKKFCSSTWLRNRKNLDYLEEPDMFHDIFGHIPLLMNESFSAFTHEFAQIAIKRVDNQEALIKMERLYWFTIEFGVILEERFKAYGAGILSSFGETNRIADHACNFFDFNLEEILNKSFRTDVMQEDYFFIRKLNDLYNSLGEVDKLIDN